MFEALAGWLRDGIHPDLSREVLGAAAHKLAHGERQLTALRYALARLLDLKDLCPLCSAALQDDLDDSLRVGMATRWRWHRWEVIERTERQSTMVRDQTHHRTYLFTLRIWPEALGDGQIEWRGKVQHVISGEARYFRDWSALVAFLMETVPEPDDRQGTTKPLKE